MTSQKSPASRTRKGQARYTAHELASGESLSNLIHKLCHEVDNPLTAIISVAAVLKRLDFSPGNSDSIESVHKYTGAITEECWRVSRILERLLYIVSTRELRPSTCAFGPLIRECLASVTDEELFSQVSVEIEGDDAESFVELDLTQGGLLIKELLLNALLAAAASLETCAKPYVRVSWEEQGSTVCCTIENSAPPIAIDNLEELFEPFVSKEKSGRRAGLGLTMAACIVKRMGGSLTLEETKRDEQSSSVTCVTLLPLQTSRQISSTQPLAAFSKPEVSPSGSQLRILIVEDEDFVASAIEKILSISFPTREVSCVVDDGTSVMERLEENHRFDAILCDLNLKNTNGRLIREQLTQSWPELGVKLAFLTGDRPSHEIQSYLESSGCPVLLKPFEPEELLALVKHLDSL